MDNQEAVRRITGQILETYGYRGLVAGDGAEALRLFGLHGRAIELVITDRVMPEMDGPTLIAALARADPTVKIIAASGLSSSGIVATARQLGLALLAKPVTAEALLRAIP